MQNKQDDWDEQEVNTSQHGNESINSSGNRNTSADALDSKKAVNSISKRKKSSVKRRKNLQNQSSILYMPIMMVLLMILGGLGYVGFNATVDYIDFVKLRNKIESNTFYTGTTIDGSSIAGMTLDEALAAFAAKEKAYANKLGMQVVYYNMTWEIGADEVGLTSNAPEMIQEAYKIGRFGSLAQRKAIVDELAINGQDFATQRKYDESQIIATANDIASKADISAVDATIDKFDTKTKTFKFIESQNGQKGDAEKLYNWIISSLDSGDYKSIARLETLEVEAELTVAKMEATFGRITIAKTDTSNVANRNVNIAIAAKAINAKKVEPGEVFSFNKATGLRTEKKGYKPAGVISGGVITEDIAGGTCQVSTTLFNAAAKAGLEIVERNEHSIKSSYVDIGLDAAVSSNYQDLKFKNTRLTPIYVMAWYKDNTMNVEIYGEALPEGIEIKLTSKEHETKPPKGTPKIVVNKALAPGEVKILAEPRIGRSASTYRVYYKNGKQIKKEFMFNSTYPPFNGITEVGPKA